MSRDQLQPRLWVSPDPRTTVMTLMDRLHVKEHVTRERISRAWVYRPAESRSSYQARLMSAALHEAADPRASLTHFVSAMSPAELEALHELLGPSHPRALQTKTPRG